MRGLKVSQDSYPKTIPSFFWNILKPYKWWLLLMVQAPVIGAFFVPVNNYALKLIVDEISKNRTFGLDAIMFPVVLYCCASVLLEVVWRVANYADYKSQPHIEADIVNQSYGMLLFHNYQFFQNNLSGKIANKVITIRDKYVSILDTIMFGMLWRILAILITLGFLFSVHLTLAIGVTVWLVIFLPLMFWMKRKGMIYSQDATDQKQRVTGLVNDGISNIANVLFFRARGFERTLLRGANEHFVKSEKKRLRFLFLNHLVMGVIYSALSISVLFLLIDLKTKDLISTGDFVMVMGLMFYMIESTWSLLNDVDFIIQDVGSLKESFVTFQQDHQVFDDENAAVLKVKEAGIRFENLTYGYRKDSLVFDQFNLSVKAGQRIGLVGSSGAGKSTLVNLLLKVFEPQAGKISIDGQDISRATFDSVRENISLIPQDPMLFHRTIFDNIAYGKVGASQQEVVQAAQKAHIHEFIETLPEGYDTLVGERGVKLSGGQRQRIAIARAILKDAPILILDEATSSLDSETESQIQQSIHEILEQHNVTVIAIAHRLATIKNMDVIVVIEQGRMVESGGFAELMSKDGKFKRLWDSQVDGMVG